MPADEHNYMSAKASQQQQQEPSEQQVEGVPAGEKRAEKRFGERLINAGKLSAAAAATTTGNNSAERQNGNKILKR